MQLCVEALLVAATMLLEKWSKDPPLIAGVVLESTTSTYLVHYFHLQTLATPRPRPLDLEIAIVNRALRRSNLAIGAAGRLWGSRSV